MTTPTLPFRAAALTICALAASPLTSIAQTAVPPAPSAQAPQAPPALRIFLNGGRNDNRGVGRDGTYDARRDWFLQNVRMAEALTEKGYDLNYIWGINTHGQRMGGAMLPEMLRWLWRDHPVSTDPTNTVERSYRQPKPR